MYASLTYLNSKHREETNDEGYTLKFLYPSSHTPNSESFCKSPFLDFNASGACDIFSFGVVLFEVIGHTTLPKNGECWKKLRNKDNEGYILGLLRLTSRSDELKSIVPPMMNNNPMNRPTAKQLLSLIRCRPYLSEDTYNPVTPVSSSPQSHNHRYSLRSSDDSLRKLRFREHKRNMSVQPSDNN